MNAVSTRGRTVSGVGSLINMYVFFNFSSTDQQFHNNIVTRELVHSSLSTRSKSH